MTGSALDRLFRRMYLVCTRMGMLFSDWEESHARNRRWWKTPDVQAIIDRLGGVEALGEGREEFHEAVLRMNRERGALMDAAAQAGARLRC